MYSQSNNRFFGPISGWSPKIILWLLYAIGGFFGFFSCGTPTNTPSTREIEQEDPAWPEERQCQLLDRFVEVFQAERVTGEDKITLMNDMLKFPQDCLQNLLAQNTEKELLLLTVWDLTRHTNPEVAQTAKNLAQKFDTSYWISEAITSENSHRRMDVVSFLLRIEPQAMQHLLNTTKLTKEDKDTLQIDLRSGTRRVLFPTGSADGERYHVQAGWDAESEEQVHCLSHLFHKALLAQRSLEEEKQILEARSETPIRSVYWYSKQWALNMAQSIESCGAQSTFIALVAQPTQTTQEPQSEEQNNPNSEEESLSSEKESSSEKPQQ